MNKKKKKKETLKIMLLQNAVKYHEARDWNQTTKLTGTYVHIPPQHCKSPNVKCTRR